MGAKDRLGQKHIEAFHEIKRLFFPRWDLRGQWRVRHQTPGGHARLGGGRCYSESKLILLSEVSMEKEELWCLIIHEICHSSISGHGKRWKARMRKAAERAKMLGFERLGEKLLKNIDGYNADWNEIKGDWIHGFPTAVYGKIEDILLDCPDITYTILVKYLARELCLSPKEFRKKYKRARKVFDDAKKEMTEWRHPIKNSLLKS